MERIVPIKTIGKEERSRSREKAPNPFLDGTDSDNAKSKQAYQEPPNKMSKAAPLAKAEVRSKVFALAKKYEVKITCLFFISERQNGDGLLRLRYVHSNRRTQQERLQDYVTKYERFLTETSTQSMRILTAQ